MRDYQIVGPGDVPAACTCYPIGEMVYPEYFADFPYDDEPASEVIRAETHPAYRGRFFDLARPFVTRTECLAFVRAHLLSFVGRPKLRD